MKTANVGARGNLHRLAWLGFLTILLATGACCFLRTWHPSAQVVEPMHPHALDGDMGLEHPDEPARPQEGHRTRQPVKDTRSIAAAPQTPPQLGSEEWLIGAEVLEERQLPASGTADLARERVVRAAKPIKYRALHVTEQLQREAAGGRALQVLSRRVYVANQVIVRLRAGASRMALDELNAKFRTSVLRKLRAPETYLIELEKPSLTAVFEAVAAYRNEAALIAYAEPNYVVHALETVPNDSRFSELYALRNTGQTGGIPGKDIKATLAWDITTGSSDVLVGVIDTGIDYNHPDLTANIWTNPNEIPGNGVDDDGNGYIDDVHGWDFANDDSDPMDDHSHGTHCAGTIGASGNNGQGVTGVCWTVRIAALKFLDSTGSGYTSDAVDATYYATSIGCDLTSNSWGGGDSLQTLKDAIDDAGAHGALYIAAAGNTGVDNDATPQYPSSYPCDNIIAVAATDHNDAMASFSCYGLTSVDLGAPGVSILSCLPGGGYGLKSGTSMATPHVAGVCALVKSAQPGIGVGDWKYRILASTDPIPALAGKCVSGGRLNAYQALQPISEPRIAVAPSSVSQIQPAGSITTQVISLDNEGSATLDWAASANPAAYGFRDSDAPDGPTYQWIEIASTGTPISLGDETNTGPVPIGFSFPFYGNDFSTLRVCSNGWLSFTHSTFTTFTNYPLPSSGMSPENLIAFFWDDLNFIAGSAAYAQQIDAQTFVLEFKDVPRYATPSAKVTCEVILKADGRILLQYQRTDSVTSCTVGIQNQDRTQGLQIAYNQTYLKPNLAIEIFPVAMWLSVAPSNGSTTANDSSTITATFDSTGLDVGSYNSQVLISSNDRTNPIVTVPVQLTVTPPPTGHLAFFQQPLTAVEGARFKQAVTVRVEDAAGDLIDSMAPVSLAIDSNPSTGTLGGTTTVNAVHGVAVFWGLSINQPGNGYTLRASSTDLTDALSSTFSIVPALNSVTRTWGDNSYGQCVPQVGLNEVVDVACRGNHTVALKTNGQVVAWGWNDNGQAAVPPGLSDAVSVAAGSYHTMALKADGTVTAWGDNSTAQRDPPSGLSDVVAIAAGAFHSLALKSDGTVVAWGANSAGQRDIPLGLDHVTAIAAGDLHSLALKADGSVVVWGNCAGTPPTNVTAIGSGGLHALAARKDGTVSVWGNLMENRGAVPPGLADAVAVSGGNFQGLALRKTGTVVSWGNGRFGEATVPSGLENVTEIASGGFHNIVAYSATPTQMAIHGGDLQVAWVGQPLPVAPSVIVTDVFDMPVAGVEVTFQVTSGGGQVVGATTQTDSFGIAEVNSWMLGALPGENTLTASSAFLPGIEVVFSAQGILPADVYVDAAWAGTPQGTDPDAGGPATLFGTDAFSTIQAGANAVAAGGRVHVTNGTYAEDVVLDRSLTLYGDVETDGVDSLTVDGSTALVTVQPGSQTQIGRLHVLDGADFSGYGAELLCRVNGFTTAGLDYDQMHSSAGTLTLDDQCRVTLDVATLSNTIGTVYPCVFDQILGPGGDLHLINNAGQYTPYPTIDGPAGTLSVELVCPPTTGLTATGVDTPTPTFSWNAVTGAVSYDVMLLYASNGAWAWTKCNVGNVTSIATAPLSAATAYRWYVRSHAPSGNLSGWNAPQTFTTGGTTLAVPTGLVASDTNTITALLSWDAAAGASSYDVMILYASTGAWVWSRIDMGNVTSIRAPELSASTEYRWYVRSRNAAGFQTGWSAPNTFTTGATVMAVPTHLVATDTDTPMPLLSWDAAAGADSYDVMLLYASTGAWVWSKIDVGNVTSIRAPALNAATGYRWYVRARNAAGLVTAWSAPNTFTTGGTALAVPTGLVATDTSTTTPLLSWNSAAGADSYDVMILYASTGAWVWTKSNTGNVTSIRAPELSASTEYRWYVRARNATGFLTGWSAPDTFTTGEATIALPTGLLATDTDTPTPLLSWNAAAGADSYDVMILNASTGAWVWTKIDVGNVTSVRAGPLNASTGYRWYVRARNAAGFVAAWSAPDTFTSGGTAMAVPTGLIATDTDTLTPLLSWNASAGADSYDVMILNAGTGAWVWTKSNTGNVTSILSRPLTSSTDYRWYVRSRNAAGFVTPWSTAQTFTCTAP